MAMVTSMPRNVLAIPQNATAVYKRVRPGVRQLAEGRKRVVCGRHDALSAQYYIEELFDQKWVGCFSYTLSRRPVLLSALSLTPWDLRYSGQVYMFENWAD